MKTLYIIRHAKSSWGDFTLPDFERPLNERGKKDAPEMASRLLKRRAKIDVFISSPAKRALKTCKLFCKAFDYDTDNIQIVDKLYHAPSSVFYEVISAIDDKYSSAAIFSHNPGITDFVNSLAVEVRIDNMPTCGIFAVDWQGKMWKDLNDAHFSFFDYPKNETE